MKAGAEIDEATVEGCRNCHRDEISLGKWSTDELILKISSILEQETAHPTSLPEFSASDIHALSSALAE